MDMLPSLRRYAAIPAAFLTFASAVSQAQDLSALSPYSVITRENFSTTSDVEGATVVGGNFTGSNSANFAIKLNGSVPATKPTLRVSGNIAAGNPINLNAGSLALGGSLNGRNVNYNGGGSLISNPGLNFSAMFAQLDEASALLGLYHPNSTASIPSGQPGPFTIQANPDADGMAVLLVDGTTLFDNPMVQQIQLSANGASAILINVSGTSVNWSSGNFVGAFTDTGMRSNIVWNFFEATNIQFGSAT